MTFPARPPSTGLVSRRRMPRPPSPAGSRRSCWSSRIRRASSPSPRRSVPPCPPSGRRSKGSSRTTTGSRAEHDDLVSEFVNSQAPSRLSQAALETLAVIAYKQPVTRGQVASIRAVNVDSVVRTLLARGLITEAFTDPDTGAIHYGTTEALLVNLGINSLDELPHISPLLDDGADGFDEVIR